MNMDTKPALKSGTVWTGLITLVIGILKLWFGVESLDAQETTGVLDAILHLKEEIAIVILAGGSIWARIVATNFDKSVFKTKVFWFNIGQGVAFILQAFGAAVDPVAAADLAVQVFTLASDGAGLTAVIAGIFMRAKSNTPIKVVKAEPVD